MKLADYLADKKLGYSAFGRLIGAGPETVRRYADGRRIPRKVHMIAIVRETAGAVGPADFYDLPAPAADQTEGAAA